MSRATVGRIASDVELLQRTAVHERDAFLDLYDRFAARMLGVISGVLRDRHAAEDVLQGVMLEVWPRYAARYDPALGRLRRGSSDWHARGRSIRFGRLR